MKKTTFSLLFMSLLLAGCIHDYTPPPPKTTDDAAIVKLSKAADSVSDSLLTLEAIKKAANPNYIKEIHIPPTPRLNRMAIVDWHGTLQALVKEIARAADYRFEELGKLPKIPIVVAINKKATLRDILRNADVQAGKRADIIVLASGHIGKGGHSSQGKMGDPGVIQLRFQGNG